MQSSCSGARSQVPALVYSSRTQGNPDHEVSIPAHPQKYHFSCCLSSHLLLLQQIATDRTVPGLDPGYRLSLRAWSARLHHGLQCSSLPRCSCGKLAMANISLRHFCHLVWLLDCLQYSLQQPCKASSSSFLPLQAGSPYVPEHCHQRVKKTSLGPPYWHKICINCLSASRHHSHPMSLGAAAPYRQCRTLTCIWKP